MILVEVAVTDITEISWDPSVWDHLAIEEKRKNLTLALASSHLQQREDHFFDDFVKGKGRGLIMLF